MRLLSLPCILWSFDMFSVVTMCRAQPSPSTQNMNQGGLPYRIANAPDFDTEELSKLYDYFDVYSLPIKTLYSQVHWTSHGAIPLPDHIIDRFQDGKVMALMGYEVDQVRDDPVTGEEVSVPITWAYNHHYIAVRKNDTCQKRVAVTVFALTRRYSVNFW